MFLFEFPLSSLTYCASLSWWFVCAIYIYGYSLYCSTYSLYIFTIWKIILLSKLYYYFMTHKTLHTRDLPWSHMWKILTTFLLVLHVLLSRGSLVLLLDVGFDCVLHVLLSRGYLVLLLDVGFDCVHFFPTLSIALLLKRTSAFPCFFFSCSCVY